MTEETTSNSTDENKHVRTRGYGPSSRKRSSVETKEPEDVFEDPTKPGRREAIRGLEEAGFLSSLEAQAYIRYVIEGQNRVEKQSPPVSSLESAKEKIAAARETVNILNGYECPQSPDECSECGSELGGVWTANLAETPLCNDCAEDARPDMDA